MQRNKLLVFFGIGVIVLLVFVGIFTVSNRNEITSTGGDFSPSPVTIVFRDSDSLYNATRSSVIDTIKSAMLEKLGDVKDGTYIAHVVDDKLTYTQTSEDMPPSYSFTVKFDNLDKTFIVDVDMSSGDAKVSVR